MITNGSDADATKRHFTGKERDTESGNDYFGARYYASNMGRWMSPDVVNVTEERMLNPSSTLNKYAYGGNNPLLYVDPDGRDITVFYTTGGPAGHAMLLAYNQETGNSEVHSFGPANHDVLTRAEESLSIPVPGTNNYGFSEVTSADQLRQEYTSITIQTSPEVAQEAINYIRTHPDNGSYVTLFNNCTSTTAKILRQLKLLKGRDIMPGGLFSHLARSYSTQGNPLFPTPGKDYGRVRNGYSPFDLLFLTMQRQQHEEVTTRICWTDDKGKKVCQ
jgi:RHS repeat-associated protein